MSDKLKLYKLNYSGAEINERLEKVDANFEKIAENLAAINENTAADAQFKAEVENTYAKKSDMPNMELYALKSELPVMPDLTNYALKSELPDLTNYALKSDIPEGQDLSAYVTKTELQEAGYITELPEIPVVPTNVSAFVNDANYLTEHQSLAGYATEEYVDNKIADVVGGAPETLDTLKEIADALNDNATMTMVSDAIATKANAEDVYTKTEIDNKGFITELPVIPTVPTNVSAFENDANYLTEHQSLENYATKQYVDDAVAEVTGGGEINLDAYATKEYVDNNFQPKGEYLTEEDLPTSPDMNLYVSKEELGNAGYLTAGDLPTIPSIDGLATEASVEAVNDRIDAILDGAPEEFDTLKEISYFLANNDNADVAELVAALESKANVDDVEQSFNTVNAALENKVDIDTLDDYALKVEIPDLTDYATASYVVDYVTEQHFLTEHQPLDDYATKQYVDNAVANVNTGGEIDLDAYATKSYVVDYVTEQNFLTEHQSLDNYVTTEALEAAGYLTSENLPEQQDLSEYLTSAYAAELYQPKGEYLTQHQDISTLATKAEVDAVNTKIDTVLADAPVELDTLKEIADLLETKQDAAAVVDALSTKANSADVYTKTEIDNAGYLTEHQDLSDYVTSQILDAKLGDFVTEGSEEHWTMNGVDYEEDPTYEVSDAFDYIHDAESWQESYENGGLALYYANNPFEDLWSEELGRVANITDHIYTCVDMVAVNENEYDEYTSKYQVLVNNPWNDSINYIKIKCIEFDGETQSTTFGVVGNEYYIEKTATPGDTLYQLYLDESLETPVNANTEESPYYCYVKITSETVPGFTQSWEGAINAPGAMYPWIVPHFENDETDVNAKIIFRYEGLDDVYPWGDRVFGNGNDHRIWGCASIPNELGNEFLLTNGETSFDINKFQMVLEHQGVTHYPAVESAEYTVKEYIDMKFQQLFEMINA